MEAHFDLGRLDIESGVPRPTTWTVESIEFPRSPVGKRGVDEYRMGRAPHQLAKWQIFGTLPLRRQAPAGGALNFGEIIQQCSTDELEQNGIAQSRGSNQPNGSFQRDARDRKGDAGHRPPRNAST